MDVNELRTIITVVCFVAFLGIVYWAYSGRQKKRFDEAANLPFADDDMQERTLAEARSSENPNKPKPAPVSASGQPGFSQSSNTTPTRMEQDHG